MGISSPIQKHAGNREPVREFKAVSPSPSQNATSLSKLLYKCLKNSDKAFCPFLFGLRSFKTSKPWTSDGNPSTLRPAPGHQELRRPLARPVSLSNDNIRPNDHQYRFMASVVRYYLSNRGRHPGPAGEWSGSQQDLTATLSCAVRGCVLAQALHNTKWLCPRRRHLHPHVTKEECLG